MWRYGPEPWIVGDAPRRRALARAVADMASRSDPQRTAIQSLVEGLGMAATARPRGRGRYTIHVTSGRPVPATFLRSGPPSCLER